jgi:hypothetical protein
VAPAPWCTLAGTGPWLRRCLVSIGNVRSSWIGGYGWRWWRWRLDARTRRLRMALSFAWFAFGLVGLVAAELTYGWHPAPIEHPWHAVAYVVLMSWLFVGTRLLHRGARP